MAQSELIQVALISLGCAKALVDSEKMMALLAEAGCVVGAAPDAADVIVVNTCAFIQPATDESLRAVREAVALKGGGRVRRVVVAGCLPQRLGRDLLKKIPGIDAAVGVFDRQAIVEAVTSPELPFVRLGQRAGPCSDDRGRFRLTRRHTAYLRLSEGCSAGCSYCTIPSIRGPLRSKPPELLLAEAAELVADGAVELNLIAQDTTAYGRDLPDGTDLASLLRRLNELAGLRWIRLMYAHPGSLTDATINALAECPKLLKYLDLPLQHVSDRILSRMRRGYDRARIEMLLATLRDRMEGIALRTTFIVGFPGETRQEFRELVDFVSAQRFEALGVFTYWPEAGTAAAALADQVSAKISRRRRDRLMRTQQQIAFAANAAKVGAELDVLVDGTDPNGRNVGRHDGQAPEADGLCYLTGPARAGAILRTRVVAWDGYDLIVERIGD